MPHSRPSLLGALALSVLAGAAHAGSTDAIRRKLMDPAAGVFVVAHRGCHNAVPSQGLGPAPENSLAALDRCVALGVDMMEVDIRRAGDGTLVVMHDATVDRTTDGQGRLDGLTLAQLRALRLRQNFGGQMSPMLTDQRVLTLDELLAAAKGRIMLNLDIKEEIYPEVIAAAVRAGVADQVVVKTRVTSPQAPLADAAPYAGTIYMPMIAQAQGQEPTPAMLAQIVESQARGVRRIPGVEMDFLSPEALVAVRAAARARGVRLWSNTLTGVGVLGLLGRGGDLDALRDAGRTWGAVIQDGVSIIQTDEPASLLAYLRRR